MAIDAVAQRSGVCSTSFVAPRQLVGAHAAVSTSFSGRYTTNFRRLPRPVHRMEGCKVRAVAEDLDVATRPGMSTFFHVSPNVFVCLIES